MSEEEKKAIEQFKSNANFCITSRETTQIILNLIEKQKNKIASQKKQIKLMQSCDLAKEISKQQKEIEEYEKELREYNKRGQTLANYMKDKTSYMYKIISRDWIEKSKIKEILKLTQNREIVKLPNNETICVSDCYELLNYLQELIEKK